MFLVISLYVGVHPWNQNMSVLLGKVFSYESQTFNIKIFNEPALSKPNTLSIVINRLLAEQSLMTPSTSSRCQVYLFETVNRSTLLLVLQQFHYFFCQGCGWGWILPSHHILVGTDTRLPWLCIFEHCSMCPKLGLKEEGHCLTQFHKILFFVSKARHFLAFH